MPTFWKLCSAPYWEALFHSTFFVSNVYLATANIHRDWQQTCTILRRAQPDYLVGGSIFARGFARISSAFSFFKEASYYGEDVVLSLIELTSTAKKRAEILELLRYCADGLRTKPGCLGTRIYGAGDQNEAILYLERWKSAEELHRHIQSNLYLGVLNAMDLASAPPDVRYYEVSETKSMELIAALRCPGVAYGEKP